MTGSPLDSNGMKKCHIGTRPRLTIERVLHAGIVTHSYSRDLFTVSTYSSQPHTTVNSTQLLAGKRDNSSKAALTIVLAMSHSQIVIWPTSCPKTNLHQFVANLSQQRLNCEATTAADCLGKKQIYSKLRVVNMPTSDMTDKYRSNTGDDWLLQQQVNLVWRMSIYVCSVLTAPRDMFLREAQLCLSTRCESFF